MATTRIVTLVPTLGAARQEWTLVGGTSHTAAVTDPSDTSYIESSTDGSAQRFELGPYRLQPGEFVSGIRARVRTETQPSHTIDVALQVVDGPDVTTCGGLIDQIPSSQPIQSFTTFLFPGAGSPYAANTTARGVMNQEMLDGLKVEVVLREFAPQMATSKVYRIAVDLYISQAIPRIVRVSDTLHLSTGEDTRLLGVNFRTDDLHDQRASGVKAELTRHRDKGFNLVRLHIYTSRTKAAAGDAFTGRELAKLVEILQHCNDIGMYVDMTLFAAYRRRDNPAWYETLSEAERWTDRQHQARQICGMFDQHPAVAWYCLGNEFVVPSDAQPFWVQDPIGPADDRCYIEMVVKDPAGRAKPDIWRDWLAAVLSRTAGAMAATTKPQPLFGCGSFPPIADETQCTLDRSQLSGLDLALLHAYPEREASASFGVPSLLGHIKAARLAGLPCVLEEFFPSLNGKGSLREMDELLRAAHCDLSGIVGHSDGLTSTDYPAAGLTERELVLQSAMRWYEDRVDMWR
jgi:hypothetical protein